MAYLPQYLTQGIVQPYTAQPAQPVQPAFDGSGMFRTPQTGTNMPVMPGKILSSLQ